MKKEENEIKNMSEVEREEVVEKEKISRIKSKEYGIDGG